MINGELDASTEIEELFMLYDRKDVLLYMSLERFFALYAVGRYDLLMDMDSLSQVEFINYIQSTGNLPISNEEKQLDYILSAYREYFGEELDIYDIPSEKYNFRLDNGLVCKLGRSSKVVRDKHLLQTIEQALNIYDRVIVVFGGAHAFAVEPALHEIMDQQ